MQMSGFLSQEYLARLKQLDGKFHAELGDNLFNKFLRSVPELAEHESFAQRGYFWRILHNQLEVIGRTERCKDLLTQLMREEGAERRALTYELLAALDHLKQNLSFLVSNLGISPDNQFYVLDNILSLCLVSEESSLEFSSELMNSAQLNTTNSGIKTKLNTYSPMLQNRGNHDRKLINRITDAAHDMLSAADIYYLEVNALIECRPTPTNLFYLFRRVESAGMNLLSKVIMAETILDVFKYELFRR